MNIARIVSGKGAVRLPGAGTFGMTVMILGLGFFLIYPAVLLLINAFNVAPEMFVPPRVWGFDNWRLAYQQPGLLVSLGNSFLIWALTMVVSFPVAVLVSWTLARTRMPFSHGLEFMFWISYMMPGLATTIAWIALLDQNAGFVNVALRKLPFIDQGLFNIYSIQGIVVGARDGQRHIVEGDAPHSRVPQHERGARRGRPGERGQRRADHAAGHVAHDGRAHGPRSGASAAAHLPVLRDRATARTAD